MRTATRWAVPGTLALTLVSGSLLAPGLANADPDLPPTTAAELLADVASAGPRGLSGTVVQTTDLGLPELPHDRDTSELSTLLTGSTTLRVWSDGAQRSRVAVLGTLAETSVVRDGRDVYVWRSDTDTAAHATVPEHDDSARAPVTGAMTPQDVAARALAAVEPSTEVSLDGTATVAGRDAYELVLTPRSDGTLVGQVRIAVDAGTSLPLRVQVTARGADEPAFATGFTSISYAAPGADVFAVPAGATVREVAPADAAEKHDAAAHSAGAGRPTVVGTGWESVLVLHGTGDAVAAHEGAARSEGSDAGLQALADAFSPVPGGRLFSSPLGSVLALDDGRVLVGAVGPEVLQRVALAPAAAVAPAP